MFNRSPYSIYGIKRVKRWSFSTL